MENVCSLVPVRALDLYLWGTSSVRIKHCARSGMQRGARHGPVFSRRSQEDVGGQEEKEWVR